MRKAPRTERTHLYLRRRAARHRDVDDGHLGRVGPVVVARWTLIAFLSRRGPDPIDPPTRICGLSKPEAAPSRDRWRRRPIPMRADLRARTGRRWPFSSATSRVTSSSATACHRATGGGAPTVLTGSLDRSASTEWSPDGKSLFVAVEDDRRGHVARARRRRTHRAADVGEAVVRDVSVGSDGSRRSSRRPRRSLRRFTRSRAGGCGVSRITTRRLKGVRLATVEDFTATAKDGMTVNGLIYKPSPLLPARSIRPCPSSTGDRTARTSTSSISPRSGLRPTATWCCRSTTGAARRGSATPEGHLRRLGKPGSRRSARRRGLGDRAGHRRPAWSPASAGGATAESRRTTRSPATRASRRRSAAPRAHRRRRVRWTSTSSTKRSRTAVEEPGAWTKVSYPFFHADRIKTLTLFRGEKDQRAPRRGRADVPGAQEPSTSTRSS